MSRYYDPVIGPPRRTQDTPFGVNLEDSAHSVYVSPYGRRNELDDQRQQNVYEDQHIGAYIPEDIPELEARRQLEYMSYIRGEHSPAGIGPHHVPSSLNSSTGRHFPARAGSLPSSPGLWDSQQNTAIQGRRDEYSDAMADRRRLRRDNSASNPDHADLRSEKDRLAKRYAEIGPTAYLGPITVRDSLRVPSLSMPRLMSVLSAEKAAFSEKFNYFQDTPFKKHIHLLDERYGREMRDEPGHRFGDVDDVVIAAYINAYDHHASYPGHRVQSIIGREQSISSFNIWVVQIPFLRLQHTAVEVMMPVDQEAITGINNDILRVLYVHLSNDSQEIPWTVMTGSVEESRRRVLRELVRRCFNQQLPCVARLRGLNSRLPSRTSRVPGRYDDPASSLMELAGPSTSVDQSSRWPNTFAAGESREPKDRRGNKAR